MRKKIEKLRDDAIYLREQAQDKDWQAEELQRDYDEFLRYKERFPAFQKRIEETGTFHEQEAVRLLVEDGDFDPQYLREIMQRHSFNLYEA